MTFGTKRVPPTSACRYNNGRFYLLVDGPAAVSGWKMSRNQDLNVLHVHDAARFVDTLDFRLVPRDTLIFDFVFFLHPVRPHR